MKSFLKIDNRTALHLPQPRLAQAIFDVVDAQRNYLGQWLPWVERTKSVDDFKRFLKESSAFNQGGQRLTTFIIHQEKIAGSVGFVKFNKDHHSGELGYWLNQDLQGRGIMTKSVKRIIDYAFRTKAINRIEIKVASGNHKSISIAERLGFFHEGTLRQAIFLYKQYHDVELFSLLKEDWKNQ